MLIIHFFSEISSDFSIINIYLTFQTEVKSDN